MKRLPLLVRLGFLGLAGCALWAGCATSERAEWRDRVGNLTFEQAVSELGPPSKTNNITDGGLIAQWATSRTTGSAFNAADGGSSGPFGTYRPSAGRLPSHVLALRFDRGHKLVEWAKVTR